MTDDNRTIGRNFRIPIDLDNKILELQKKKGINKITDAYIMVLEMGMEVVEYLEKTQASPEEHEKIVKELEDNVNKVIKHSVGSLRLSEENDETLEYILAKVAAELKEREMKRAQTDGYQTGNAIWRRIQDQSRLRY